MIGTFGPYTSASIQPTRAPSNANATARFTATVDFPTPPLPDETAMMFLTPGTETLSPMPRPFGTSASMVTLTDCTPGIAPTYWCAAVSISALTGHAGGGQHDAK